MDFNRVCSEMKERLSRDLERERDPLAREELLLDALYEVGRDLLPALGTPRKSQQYLEAREAVLELVTRIVIPLVRAGGSRGVVALSQLAEECQDPLLKKKLSVYAQQLRAKGRGAGKSVSPQAWRPVGLALGVVAVVAGGIFFFRPASVPEGKVPAERTVLAPAAQAPEPARAGPAASLQAPCPADQPPALQPQQRQEKQQPPPQGEQVTRVRVVDNQVLVPVLLRHGGGTVKLELLLDTGATRTAVHEGVATRLPIDLRSARSALAEVADGRMIRSRVARIDQLSVGPFSHPALEVELIPYAGGEARHDGLLGMDVLGRHRYQIDMEHELIRWY